MASAAAPTSVEDARPAPKVSVRIRVHRFPASAIRRRSVVFKVHGIKPTRVRSASVVLRRRAGRRYRSHRRRLGLRKARHGIGSGRLKVRARVSRALARRPGLRPLAIVRTVGPPIARPGTCTGPDFSGIWPTGCWRPYGDSSPFNRPVPANPKLSPDSAEVVRRMTRWGEAQSMVAGHPRGSDSDYAHPVYYAKPDDPVYEVHCTKWTADCEIDGMEVRIPPLAEPAGGGDGHMAVIDAENGWEYDFWQVQNRDLAPGGGRINVSHGGRTRWGTPDADGLGSDATAAHFALDAGVIRAEEWQAAVAIGGGIEHALFMTVKCSGGYSVYPAAAGTTAASCSSFGSSNADAPAVGARFYLDLSDARIESLRVPAWKKPILKAMANYGLIVGDTFANHDNSFGLMTESDAQYRALGEPGRFAALGSQWGVGTWDGARVFDIDSGVDWARHLKLLAPCVSQGSC